MVQFDERSDRYRCCCECCHVKNISLIIGCIELVILFYYLVNSLFLIAETSGENIPEEELGLIYGPFIACMTCLAIATLVIILLFIAVAKKYTYCVLPHLIVQVLSIPVLITIIIIGVLALATHRTTFYRLLNATSFHSRTDDNTVDLPISQLAKVYAMLVVYLITLVLEIWFSFVLWRFYIYLKDRNAYMQYCLAYCTPMKTVKVRVPLNYNYANS